jgi:hypothetical protein
MHALAIFRPGQIFVADNGHAPQPLDNSRLVCQAVSQWYKDSHPDCQEEVVYCWVAKPSKVIAMYQV